MCHFALGKFFAVYVGDEPVVEVDGRFVTAEQAHQGNLPGGGTPDVFAADHVRYPLVDVVDADGELVRPLAVAVADGEVPALLLGILAKVSQPQVVPFDYFICNDDAQVMRRQSIAIHLSSLVSRLSSKKTLPAVDDFARLAPGVFFLELLAAAVARVDEVPRLERL